MFRKIFNKEFLMHFMPLYFYYLENQKEITFSRFESFSKTSFLSLFAVPEYTKIKKKKNSNSKKRNHPVNYFLNKTYSILDK